MIFIVEGETSKEIDTSPGLSYKTVKNYSSNVLEKLQLTRNWQAAAFFV